MSKAKIIKVGHITEDNVMKGWHFEGGFAGIRIDSETGEATCCGYTLEELKQIIREANESQNKAC